MEIEVRDRAGNRDVKSQIVHCDDTPPQIEHAPSSYSQARDSTAKVQLTHRLVDAQRLEFVAAKDAPLLEAEWSMLNGNGASAPPTLNFTVRDPGPLGTSTEQLVNRELVTYKYIFTGRNGRHFETDWRPVDCALSGACKVPFTYQAMLTDSVLRLPLTQAREQNFIARATKDERHTVLVKVEDLAGNVTLAEWSFRLNLFTPKVEFECENSSEERRLWAAPGQSIFLQKTAMQWVKSTASVPSAVVAHTDLRADDQSLTPTDVSHLFAFPSGTMEWRIDRTWRICENQSPHKREDGAFVVSQTLQPREKQVEFRAGNERVRNPLVSKQRFEYMVAGGNTAYLTTAVYNGRAYPKLEFSSAGPIDYCFVVMDMRQIRRAYRVEYKGSRTNSPEPLSIETGTCGSEVTTSWREDHAPVIYTGKAPDLLDTESHYH